MPDTLATAAESPPALSRKEVDILLHTSRTGRYVSDEPAALAMASSGLLRDFGPQRIAGGMHYFETAALGRQAINTWQAAQPKRKPLTRSQRRYRDYLDADGAFEDFKSFLLFHTRKAERSRELRRLELEDLGLLEIPA